MRKSALSLATLTAALLLGSSAGHADPYRWCAVYGGGDSGTASNCGFVTLEQCRATISGIGGVCSPNPFYTGSDRDESRPALHRRQQPYR
jgi:hypothetical protein